MLFAVAIIYIPNSYGSTQRTTVGQSPKPLNSAIESVIYSSVRIQMDRMA